MTLAAAGQADWPAAFRRMHESEDAFYISDTSYVDLFETLTTSTPPLLTGSSQAPSLTREGREVLDGRADRIAMCGIDRWFGGVHLQGHAVPWRWDGDRQRIARA